MALGDACGHLMNRGQRLTQVRVVRLLDVVGQLGHRHPCGVGLDRAGQGRRGKECRGQGVRVEAVLPTGDLQRFLPAAAVVDTDLLEDNGPLRVLSDPLPD